MNMQLCVNLEITPRGLQITMHGAQEAKDKTLKIHRIGLDLSSGYQLALN